MFAASDDSELRWGREPWTRPGSPPRSPNRRYDFDVIVIGGGLTGLSAAYHLARRQVRVGLFEMRRLGMGASGRTGGIVLEGTAAGPRPGADSCLETLERVVHDEGIECELRLNGCWEIAHEETPGSVRLPWQDDGRTIHIARTVAGGTVEPGALLAGLIRAASRAGACLYEQTPVTQIQIEPRPRVTLSDGTVVSVDALVVATNAWLQTLLAGVRTVTSALTFACVTESLAEGALTALKLHTRMPFYTIDTPYLWGRVCADNRVVFGAGLVFDSPRNLEKVDINGSEARAIFHKLFKRIRGLNPVLAGIRFTSQWAGPIGIAEGRLPLIGRLAQSPRVLVAAGYAGHGVALSVHAGALIARSIVHDEPLPSWAQPSI